MIFNAETVYSELHPHFQERIRLNEPLADHCSFGVGGPADVWISLEALEELKGVVRLCAEYSWPMLLVGNSTNVLYADAGVRGIVAQIAASRYRIEEKGNNTALLIADAGVSWRRLSHELAPQGWGGLEFGVGIPGTLGGAVISNAGAHDGDLGQVLQWIEVLDARRCGESEEDGITMPLIRRYQHNELDLGYRHSRFREERRTRFDKDGHIIPAQRVMIEPPEIVMVLAINVHRDDPQKLQALVAQNIEHRQKTQPQQQRTGLIFKDPAGNSAGHLIEQAGLKGTIRGQAQISTLDPNFIINLGGAHAADVVALITEAHHRVLATSGVDLEVEVELCGEWKP